MPYANEILAAVTRGLLGSIQGRGLERSVILEKAGLTEDLIADPDAWIPIVRHIAVGLAIVAAFPDQNLGLQTGAAIYGDPRGALGYTLRLSGAHGVGLKNFCAYQQVVNRSLRVELSATHESTSLELHMVPELSAVAHPAEALFAAWVAVSRHLTCSSWCPVEVRFIHDARGPTSDHREFFGCPVHFARGASTLVVPGSACRLPIARTPHALDGALGLAHERALPLVGNSREASALQSIVARLSSVPLDVRAIGAGELRSARLALARGLLERSELFVFEVAYLLGFDDLRSFEEQFFGRFGVQAREQRSTR